MGGCLSEKEGRKEGDKTYGEERGRRAGQLSEDELRTAIDKIFNEYDKDKSGGLDKHEVTTLLSKSLGRTNLTDREVKEFMGQVDADGSTTLDRDQLFKLYKRLYC